MLGEQGVFSRPVTVALLLAVQDEFVQFQYDIAACGV
jgi:hypothetical protein